MFDVFLRSQTSLLKLAPVRIKKRTLKYRNQQHQTNTNGFIMFGCYLTMLKEIMVDGVLYGIHLVEELSVCSDDVQVIFGGDNIFDYLIPLAWTTATMMY